MGANQRMTPVDLAIAAGAALGSLLLFISLFLDWYSIDEVDGDDSVTIGGWSAFEFTDVVIVLAILATIVLVAQRVRGGSEGAGPPLVIVGCVVFVFVVLQLLSGHPTIEVLTADPTTEGEVEASLGIGAWLGLLGAIVLLAAGVLEAVGPRGSAPGDGASRRPRPRDVPPQEMPTTARPMPSQQPPPGGGSPQPRAPQPGPRQQPPGPGPGGPPGGGPPGPGGGPPPPGAPYGGGGS